MSMDIPHPENYPERIQSALAGLFNGNIKGTSRSMEKDSIKEIEKSIVETQKILARMDERMSHLATKEEVQEVKSQVSHAAAKEDTQKLEMSVKEDIQELEIKVTRIEGKLALHNWMLGVIIAGIASLIIKAFFL